MGQASALAFGMTEFMTAMRQQSKLRFITVERNGFSDTPMTPGWGYGDHVAEVRAVLDHLDVKRFAAAMPERLISVHMLAAAIQRPAGDMLCKLGTEQMTGVMKSHVQNPGTWWGFGKESPTHQIPGFADRAYEEGARAFFVRGQMGDPAPEVAEILRYCGPVADMSAMKAPAFIYQGAADPLVTMASAEYWRDHVPNLAEMRVYPGEGHDVQYRH